MGTLGNVDAIDPRLPVVVGVGQVLNRTDQGADMVEPVELMIQAARIAEDDAGSSGYLKRAEVIAAIPTISWRYRDPGAIAAQAFGAEQAKTWYATVGGNTPQTMVNRISSHIQSGQLDVAVLIGGEAGRARSEAKRQDIKLDWAVQGDEATPDLLDDNPFLMGGEADMARKLIMPLQLYPVFENAIWHNSGRTLDEHLSYIAELWSGYSKVAAGNPYAWNRRELTADELLEVTPENRMVAFPYRKQMVSNPSVDMSSAILICSVEAAREMGIPMDRWVFVHSGTDAKDRSVSDRLSLAHSSAIGAAGNRALELAGVSIDDVAHLDVYSCYPSAVQVAMDALGIGPDRQLTVYGGLPFAGGPWNNPVGHAIASMVGVLREDTGSVGLVTANGGNIDKHAFGVYSSSPPTDGFRYECPQDQVDSEPGRGSVVDHLGEAAVESWSVLYDRESNPVSAHVAALTPDGSRTWALCDDQSSAVEMTTGDMTGRTIHIDGQGAFNLG